MSQPQTKTTMLIGLTTILLAIGSLLISVPSLASAIFASGLNNQSGQENLNAFLNNHEEDLGTYLDRFQGRSLFFRPPAPAKKVVIQETIESKVESPKPLGPPTTYTGPKVIGVFGNVVWFRDNLKIPVGEESSGVKVLENNAPWSVKLAHAGGEYDVPIFSDRIKDSDEFSNPLKLKSIPGITYDDNKTDSDNSADNKKRGIVRQ